MQGNAPYAYQYNDVVMLVRLAVIQRSDNPHSRQGHPSDQQQSFSARGHLEAAI